MRQIEYHKKPRKDEFSMPFTMTLNESCNCVYTVLQYLNQFYLQNIMLSFLLGSTRHHWTCVGSTEFTQHATNNIDSIEKIYNCKHTKHISDIRSSLRRAIIYYVTINYNSV